MGTQYETVNVVIGGANPQTIPVTVGVDTTTGAGTATLTYTGTVGGSDTLQGSASIAGNNYTSNVASVNWQQSNGTIQIGSIVTCYAWNDSPTSGPVAAYTFKNPSDSGWGTNRTINTALATQTNNSLAFDAYIANASGDDPSWSIFNSLGVQTGVIDFPPYSSNFNCIITGNLLVPVAGTYTLTVTYKDGVNWGIGASATGAMPTWSGIGTITGTASQTMTVNGGFPLLPAPQNNGGGGYVGTSSIAVTFSQAGVYPIEGNWDYWYHSGRVFHITSSSGELAPVTLIAAPAASTPTGNLTITPAGGATNLQITGQPITLSVNVSGIVYPTIFYIPVFEGTTGTLNLYNDPSNPTFTFQTYNGQSVDKAAAASSSLFTLSSTDNTAYQGLISLGYDGTNFTLNYNGGSANAIQNGSQVLSTSLVIQADDIAWYNSTNKSFDLFSAYQGTGWTSFNMDVFYMNNPQVSSISPTLVVGNGSDYILSIALTEGFPPQQQGSNNTGNSIVCSCTVVGATATGTPSPTYTNGWLTGWNVPFTAPSVTTNQTLTVNLSVTGTLTYLSGNTFVTNSVTYINEDVGTITASGTSFTSPPVAVGMAVSTATVSGLPGYTLAASVFTTTNDTVTCTFFKQPVAGSTQTTISSGTMVSAPATYLGTVGYMQTLTTSFVSQYWVDSGGDYFGFNAVDNSSNQTCSYTTTTDYTQSGSASTPSGCPAIDMYVLPDFRVAEVVIGTELDAILNFQDEKKLPVQWMDFSDEVCYRFEAENGAAVVVSESTPIPTLETIEGVKVHGLPMGELPQLAPAIRSGMHVLTNIDGKVGWSMLVETALLGVRRVARLYIGGENYAAGEVPNKRIYTHNFLLNNSGPVK
jgi:hypothetical protein